MKNPTGILMGCEYPIHSQLLAASLDVALLGAGRTLPPSSLEPGGSMAAVGRGLSGHFLSPVPVPSRRPQLHQGPRLDSPYWCPLPIEPQEPLKGFLKTKQNKTPPPELQISLLSSLKFL